MRAVLIATGYQELMKPLLNQRPTPLLRIADKPILFHIIEFLAHHDIRKIDLVLHYYPELIEEKIGDGSRWGVEIAYHLTRTESHPYSLLRTISHNWEDDLVLIGQADCLPNIDSKFLDLQKEQKPKILQYSSGRWTGWALAPASSFADISQETTTENFVSQFPNFQLVPTLSYLSTQSLEDLKETNETFLKLNKTQSLFPSTASMAQPGIWISRAVSMHPSVTITPPIFIGENCQIHQGAHLGPNTVIEKECIVDRHSKISNSVICHHSYVGECLELDNSIVDRNLLLNLSLNTQVHVQDDFILGELKLPSLTDTFVKFIGRLLAIILLVYLSPLYLFLRMKYKLLREKKVLIPTNEHCISWKTFQLLSFDIRKEQWGYSIRSLPQIINIIKGEMRWIGLEPRSSEEIEALSPDWQKLYLKGKTGFITFVQVIHGDHPSQDDLYTSESYYVVEMGWIIDIKIFLKWVRQKLESLWK